MSKDLSRYSLMTFPFIMDVSNNNISAKDIFRLCAENGLSWVDMFAEEFKLYGEGSILEYMNENKVALNCVIASLPFITGSAKDIENELVQSLEICAKFNCDMLMIVPYKYTLAGIANISQAVVLEKIRSGYALAVKVAERYDVKISFENTPVRELPLSSAKNCKSILESIPGLSLVFDTANMMSGGDYDTIEFYEKLKTHIKHVHLKDVFWCDEPCEYAENGKTFKCCPWGEGIIPIKQVISTLKADNYPGNFGIEYSSPKDRSLGGHKNHLKKYLNNYS